MRRIGIVFALLILGSGIAWAQPQLNWSTQVGFPDNDWANAIVKTSTFGYAVGGGAGNSVTTYVEPFVATFGSSGDLLWINRYPIADGDSWVNGMMQLEDGGFVIVGAQSEDPLTAWRLFIKRVDRFGEEVWSYLPMVYTEQEYLWSVLPAEPGMLYVGGTATGDDPDFYLMKITVDGAPVWEQSYDYGDNEYGQRLIRLADGNLMMAGTSWDASISEYQFRATKINPQGDQLWTAMHGDDADSYVRNVTEMSNGDLVLCGITTGYGATVDGPLLMRLSSSGALIWAYRTGMTEGYGYDVFEGEGGTIYFCGGQRDDTGDWNAFVRKLTGTGSELWLQWSGVPDSDEHARAFIPDAGGYTLVSYGYWGGQQTDINLLRYGEAIASVDIDPVGSTQIPPSGGQLTYNILIDNNLQSPQSGDVWVQAVLPGGFVYPVGTAAVTLPPGQPIEVLNLGQAIPANAPPGTYMMQFVLGIYPGFTFTLDEFPFEKTAGLDLDPSIPLEWEPPTELAQLTHRNVHGAAAAGDTPVAYRFSLRTSGPNPFNPSTTVAVTLPAEGELNVRVVNVEGRTVSTLADGWFPVGEHRFSVDGARWASGLYFIQARASGHETLTRKLMLVR